MINNPKFNFLGSQMEDFYVMYYRFSGELSKLMENLPRPEMILAGFLAHNTLTRMIVKASEGIGYSSAICDKGGIYWGLLIVSSVTVAFYAAIKSVENNSTQRVIAFVGSFLLNVSGNYLGYISIHCSHQDLRQSYTNHHHATDIYLLFTIPTMLIAALFVTVRFLKRESPHVLVGSTNLPDPEILLLGVCVQNMIGKFFYVNAEGWVWEHFCSRIGMVCWMELLTVSAILSIFTFIKATKQYRIPQSLFTFFASFVIHLTIGGTGWWVMFCTLHFTILPFYDYVSWFLNVIIGLAIAINFLVKSAASPPVPEPVSRGYLELLPRPSLNAPPYPPKDQPSHPAQPY